MSRHLTVMNVNLVSFFLCCIENNTSIHSDTLSEINLFDVYVFVFFVPDLTFNKQKKDVWIQT